MTSKTYNILAQVKFLIHLSHGHLPRINALKSSRIVLIKAGNIHQEFSESTFFKRPIRLDARASASVEGALQIFPPL